MRPLILGAVAIAGLVGAAVGFSRKTSQGMKDLEHIPDDNGFGKSRKAEILERLDQYRQIEIQNLWERSVLLGTFLVLGYTGYGFLVNKMVPFQTDIELKL